MSQSPRDQVIDYLYDELSPAERQTFEAAMRGDPTLAAEVQSLETTRTLVHRAAAAPPAAPSALMARLQREARLQASAEPAPSFWQKLAAVLFQPAAGFALVVASVIGVGLWVRYSNVPAGLPSGASVAMATDADRQDQKPKSMHETPIAMDERAPVGAKEAAEAAPKDAPAVAAVPIPSPGPTVARAETATEATPPSGRSGAVAGDAIAAGIVNADKTVVETKNKQAEAERAIGAIGGGEVAAAEPAKTPDTVIPVTLGNRRPSEPNAPMGTAGPNLYRQGQMAEGGDRPAEERLAEDRGTVAEVSPKTSGSFGLGFQGQGDVADADVEGEAVAAAPPPSTPPPPPSAAPVDSAAPAVIAAQPLRAPVDDVPPPAEPQALAVVDGKAAPAAPAGGSANGSPELKKEEAAKGKSGRLQVAEAHYQAQRYDQAIREFEAYLDEPGSGERADARERLAQSYERANRLEQAAAAYKSLLANSPTYRYRAAVLIAAAQVETRLGRLEAARELLRQALGDPSVGATAKDRLAEVERQLQARQTAEETKQQGGAGTNKPAAAPAKRIMAKPAAPAEKVDVESPATDSR